MDDLLERWWGEAAAWPAGMPDWIAGYPVVWVCALAMILAVAGRHRHTLLEVAALSLLALATFRFWDIPAMLLSVGALLSAVRAAERRKLAGRLHALDQRIDAVQSSLDGFFNALERRAREVDGRAANKEFSTGKVIGPQAAGAPPRSPPNGAEPDPAARGA